MSMALVNKIQLSEELIHQFAAIGKLLIDPKKFTITSFIPSGERPLFDTKNKRMAVCSKQRKTRRMQRTGGPQLRDWHQVTEMLAKEKERHILAAFIALDAPNL